MKIVVLMTVFNRFDKTSKCIDSLLVSDGAANIARIILVDSGSDMTGSKLAQRHSIIQTISAPSETYWAEGMRIAWQAAQEFNYDGILWLNDDVWLNPDWFVRLLGSQKFDPSKIYAGICVDPRTKVPSYGGFNLGPLMKRLAFESVFSDGTVTRCDTMNGNVVLIPRDVDEELKGFPTGFRHNLADLVYGLRATRSGFPVVLSAQPVGECERDHGSPKWLDPRLSRLERLKICTDVKSHPVMPWLRFCAEFGGVSFVAYFLRPYVKAIVASPVSTKSAVGVRNG